MTLPSRRRPAATLIEVVVATTLTGVVLVAALDTVGSAARTHLAASAGAEAWALAELYAAEALATAYEEPSGGAVFGIESGDGSPTSRAGLDDVDDYHNWVESPPKGRDGAALAGYTGWSVGLDVALVEAAPTDGDAATVATDQGLKRVRVTVTDPAGEVAVVDTLRSRYGAGEHDAALSLTEVSSLSVDLTVGEGKRQVAADQHLNGAPTP